jgi:hypothetical protein
VSFVTAVLAAAILLAVLWDGFETMVLPRRVTRKFRIARTFYRIAWRLWRGIGLRMKQGRRRETYLSVFGPLSLFLLFLLWAVSLLLSFTLMFHSAKAGSFLDCFYMAGSSFFTLGSSTPRNNTEKILDVAAGGVGMGFLALVISYLPVMYQSFSRRETVISLLDARAGSPAAAVELLRRHGHSNALDHLPELLREWERWAAEVLEGHISYPVLLYFRSQHDNQSWLATLTTMLDTCALVIHGIGGPAGWQAQLTFAMARHAVVDLSQVLGSAPVPPEPDRLPPADFKHLRETLAKAGVDLGRDPQAEANVAELRALYEPYVNSLGDQLLLRCPPWLHSGRIDNWRTSAWGRISTHKSVLPLADLGDDEHS